MATLNPDDWSGHYLSEHHRNEQEKEFRRIEEKIRKLKGDLETFAARTESATYQEPDQVGGS